MKGLKVRASALQLVIVLALVIGLICASLVGVAYYYRAAYLRAERYALLKRNLVSATNLLLAGQDTSYQEKNLSLFGGEQDSLQTNRLFWGLYDIGVARTFIQKDTLSAVFSIGNVIDSARWCALYLADNQRPLIISGKTVLRGDIYVPPAGLNQAYVNNQAYTGNPKLFSGKKHNSNREISELDAGRLQLFRNLAGLARSADSTGLTVDSLRQSFRAPLKIFHFKRIPETITAKLSGHILLYSDSTLTIDSTAALSDVLVIAKNIIVRPGFTGHCQLYASDSLLVGKRCCFSYPSVLGILHFGQQADSHKQAQLHLASHVTLTGALLTCQEANNQALPALRIDSVCQINGEVYAQDILELQDHVTLNGAVFANRFLYRAAYTVYENYLVNATFDEPALSAYYLSGRLLPAVSIRKKILQWLERN